MIHHIFACKSNIGDWLSARGIQALLAPAPITEYYCDEPFVDSTVLALSRDVRPGDVVVIGGGGLFMDYFAPFWRTFESVCDRAPFVIWGAGYCDLKQSMSRAPDDLLCRVIGRSRYCFVRDELTRGYLGCLSLPLPVACPSASVLVTGPEARGMLHVSHYGDVGPDAYGWMDCVGRRFAGATRRPFTETCNQISDGSEPDLEDVLSRYAAADIVLSSRLHGCILAVAMGRKVVAVSADRKIDAFMGAAGLDEWVIGVGDKERLESVLEQASNQPSASDFIERTRRDNEAIARQVVSLHGG